MTRHRDFNFEKTKKFDLQLRTGVQAENLLAKMIQSKKIEVKTESYYWENTGNLAIEYARRRRIEDGDERAAPSGIAATEADYWAHEMFAVTDGEHHSCGFILLPIKRMKQLTRWAIMDGRIRWGGDGSLSKFALVRISDLWSPIPQHVLEYIEQMKARKI